MSTVGTSNVIPSSVQVATSQNYLASNAIYDVRKPVIDPQEAQVWGSGDITGLIDYLGGKNFIASSFYRHFETTRNHQIVNASGTTVGSLGAVTYTIASADTIANFPDQYGTAPFDPYVASNAGVNLLPVRVQDVLLFPNGVFGRVDSVNQSAGTFVVYPTGSVDLPTTVDADNIVNLGASNVEGGVMPDPMNYRDNVYYNVTQTMNDSFASTGTSMAEQIWFTTKGENGEAQYTWTMKGIAVTHKRFRNFIEMRNVVSEPVTNTTTLPDNNYTQTQGLIPFAKSYGNNTTYDIGTGLTLDDFNTLVTDQIDKNKGDTENSAWMGIAVRAQIDAFIRVQMQNGGVVYNAFGGDEKQYVNFGFNSFQTLGYTFHCKTYQLFNDPTLLGGIESYRNLLVGVPMNKEMYSLGDNKEKSMCPPLRINYKKMGNYDRSWEEFPLGGANGVYTNGTDLKSINMRSENGFEGFGANKYFTVQGENL